MQTDLIDNLPEEIPDIATIRSRIFAAVIDGVIFLLVGVILAKFFGTSFTNDDGSFGFELKGFAALLWMLSWFILFPISEGVTGQTIGKKVLRIIVVKTDYSHITFLSTFIRHFFDVIDFIFFIGLIVAANNKNKQRIGDLAAKTIVVMKTT